MIMKDKYFFLSNFYPCNITIEIKNKKLTFQSVEAAFQACKNEDLADKFCLLKPLEAKRYGKEIDLTTPDWNTERLYIMGKLLHQKFRDLELLAKLKNVKEPIVEDNYWNDTFWGVCRGQGKNMLGKLLTNIKENNNNLEKLLNYISDTLLWEI